MNEVFEEYWYVPLETRDDALIEELYNIKNIVIYQEDIYIGSGNQLIIWDKYGKNQNAIYIKREKDPQSYFFFRKFLQYGLMEIFLISSANDITTYSNSFKFIRKWADHKI